MAKSNSGLFSIPSFKNRGIIKLAPDALVYINGAVGSAVVAPVSGGTSKLNFNDGITSINVTSSIEPAGSGRATIEITTPIYNEKSNYWVVVPSATKKTTWVPVLTPMMEVKIFFKGRYLVNGEPKYYPAFWGLITSVDEGLIIPLHSKLKKPFTVLMMYYGKTRNKKKHGQLPSEKSE